MGSIQIPFEIGEEVWWIGHGSREETVTCPECVGKKFITLIQGNGVKVDIDCACCGTGFDGPRGVIRETLNFHEPTRVTLGEVYISGKDVRYSHGSAGWQLDASGLFKTKEDCLAECVKLNKAKEENRKEQAVNYLKSKRREMAWSVHYWQGQVRDLRSRLDAAERRLDVCKAKKIAAAFKPLADVAEKTLKKLES